MDRRNTRTVGTEAEGRAHRFLINNGLQSVTRNFQCRLGEIDLVMQDDGCLVFVEVRYRTSNDFVPARLTVDSHKQRKLIRTAALFMARQARFANSVVRFDVVAIEGNSIEWIRDAFRPADNSL